MTVQELKDNKRNLGKEIQELKQYGKSITPSGKNISIQDDKFLYEGKLYTDLMPIIAIDLGL